MVYVLIGERSVSTISSSLVDTTFLVTPPVVYSITYPLVSDELIQFTLILVAFNINPLTLFGGPLGARNGMEVPTID